MPPIQIRFYNTLSGKVEEFVPLKEGEVKMYVCGMTVYDDMHIGHARTFVFFDFVQKFFSYLGYDVRYVMNITDVEDKIIKRAEELGMHPLEYASKYSKRFLEDYLALKMEPPEVFPKVSQHIPEILDLIQRLIDKGMAYVNEGNVYFSVKKFPEYGKLSKRKPEEMIAGARVEIAEGKKDPLDFALWKRNKGEEVFWDSPWGKGRPGWHIECSAMSMKYLGETFDIHGGGSDLIFPHHENEIAQSEGATGKTFARYWIHVAMLNYRAEKMSKSIGNVVKIREILKAHSPYDVRFYLLNSTYRKPIEFYEGAIEEAKEAKKPISSLFGALQTKLEKKDFEDSFRLDDREIEALRRAYDARRKFIEALSNDFNTREGIKELISFSKYAYNMLTEGKIKAFTVMARIYSIIRELAGEILTIVPLEREGASPLLATVVEKILALREEFRRERNYEVADKIRACLRDAGIKVDDTREGPVWRIERSS